MKLTKEQEEIQRVKFEDFYSRYIYEYIPMFTNGEYEGDDCQNCFEAWLACRESNNEILITGYAESGGAWQHGYNCAIIECKEEIESQGYTIKIPE